MCIKNKKNILIILLIVVIIILILIYFLFLKAKWKLPYVCPDDCIPSIDGSTCTRTVTTNISKKTLCPSGYIKNDTCKKTETVNCTLNK